MGFKTVFHLLADEGIKFNSQKLYSPKVPLVETCATMSGLEIKQETFSYSSAGTGGFGQTANWKERKSAPREDIIITRIINTGTEPRSVHPLVVVNSEHQVRADPSMIEVNGSNHLYLSRNHTRIRQNIGDEKTLVDLQPITVMPGEIQTLVAIYDNGRSSALAHRLIMNPKETISEIQKIRKEMIDYWENNSPVPFGHICIPDQGIQDLLDASLRNIWQAREIIDGKISFQVGPTCYRGLWIVDGAFILETATMVGKGNDAREGIEYMLSFQQANGKFGKLTPSYWKENGIVLWTCVRHAMLCQDKEWLRSVWPRLRKTVGFIKEMRQMTLENDILVDDGLIPPGDIDGGLWGAEDQGEYTNIYWNLLGLKAMVGAAEWIGEDKDARKWKKEYDDFYATFQKAAHRDMAVDAYGNSYLPIPMESRYHSLPQRAQWAFCQGVYPGQLFTREDPIARGTLDMLHTTLQEGMVMGTGWIIDGIWNYFASFYGHACLWMGDSELAAESLYAFANHASPLLAWREEHNPRDLPRHFVGDMPHNWASAEFVRLAIHLLALDRGSELHLFEGLPKEWTGPGMETACRQVATPFGALSFSLKVDKTGKEARLIIDPLPDDSCSKIVVHKKGWSVLEGDRTIELDPSKPHHIKIAIAE